MKTKLAIAFTAIALAAPAARASSLTHAWAKAARECNESGSSPGCAKAEVYWNRLTAAGCKYDAPPHSFDPTGWYCRTR
jgi:hypothetical protein